MRGAPHRFYIVEDEDGDCEIWGLTTGIRNYILSYKMTFPWRVSFA